MEVWSKYKIEKNGILLAWCITKTRDVLLQGFQLNREPSWGPRIYTLPKETVGIKLKSSFYSLVWQYNYFFSFIELNRHGFHKP